MSKSAVVLLSGGQDSTTCLFLALSEGYDRVLCLSVHYGQKHELEVKAAEAVVEIARGTYPDADIQHETVALGRILGGTSPLVSDKPLGTYESVEVLPGGVEDTFVPGRNLLFLVIAANRAAVFNAEAVITGVAQEDFGGYFDCRRVFIDAAEVAIAQAFVGEDAYLRIETPLMDLDKESTVHLAMCLPGCMDALAHSHTCYAGTFPPCGKCHACHLRVRGFESAGVVDPLMARASK